MSERVMRMLLGELNPPPYKPLSNQQTNQPRISGYDCLDESIPPPALSRTTYLESTDPANEPSRLTRPSMACCTAERRASLPCRMMRRPSDSGGSCGGGDEDYDGEWTTQGTRTGKVNGSLRGLLLVRGMATSPPAPTPTPCRTPTPCLCSSSSSSSGFMAAILTTSRRFFFSRAYRT